MAAIPLETIDLDKTYEGGERALRGVDVRVNSSEIVSVIGPSGAGKSTFIRCINRLVEPSGGRVLFYGTDLTGLSKRELRKARRDIGMVFQEYNLVERLTVMENVMSGRLGYLSTWNALRRNYPSEDVSKAYEVIDKMGLAGHEDKRASALSGGQRQRVGIARSVMQDPKLLLADEPTSSLDPETSETVMDLISEVADSDDIPVVMNLHDVDLAIEYSDRIIGLNQGSLVFEGPPESLDDDAREDIYSSTPDNSVETAVPTQ